MASLNVILVDLNIVNALGHKYIAVQYVATTTLPRIGEHARRRGNHRARLLRNRTRSEVRGRGREAMARADGREGNAGGRWPHVRRDRPGTPTGDRVNRPLPGRDCGCRSSAPGGPLRFAWAVSRTSGLVCGTGPIARQPRFGHCCATFALRALLRRHLGVLGHTLGLGQSGNHRLHKQKAGQRSGNRTSNVRARADLWRKERYCDVISGHVRRGRAVSNLVQKERKGRAGDIWEGTYGAGKPPGRVCLVGSCARSKKARYGGAGRARTFPSWALFAVDTLLDCSQDVRHSLQRGVRRTPCVAHFGARGVCVLAIVVLLPNPVNRSVAPHCQANCGSDPDARKPATAVPGGPRREAFDATG
jgi:hypothetical protein